MKQNSEDDFHALICNELKGLGVKVPKGKKLKHSSSKQDKQPNDRNRIFGVSLADQDLESEAGCILPKFILSATSYLRQHANAVGLFREAGSVARQRVLKVKLEKGGDLDGSDPNDVASLLKRWMRELPEPIIPCHLHELFAKCHGLENGNTVTAVLLACLLLPAEHLYTLKHLLCFLSEIASCSNVNKMVPHNLAVVMAPNLFTSACNRTDKVSGSMIDYYTAVVEVLIENASSVGEIPSSLASQFAQKLDVPVELLNGSPSKIKKKFKSGGLDIMGGIRKLVTNSLTPINNCMDAVGPSQKTTARLAIDAAQPKSYSATPLTNISRAGCSLLLPSSDANLTTPKHHNRRKSFGLLRKKQRKREKLVSKVISSVQKNSPVVRVSPLPSNQASPKTSPLPSMKVDKTPSPQHVTPVIPLDAHSPVILNYKSSPYLSIPGQVTRTLSDSIIKNKNSKAFVKSSSISQGNLPINKPSPSQSNDIPVKRRSTRNLARSQGSSTNVAQIKAQSKSQNLGAPKLNGDSENVQSPHVRRINSARQNSKRKLHNSKQSLNVQPVVKKSNSVCINKKTDSNSSSCRRVNSLRSSSKRESFPQEKCTVIDKPNRNADIKDSEAKVTPNKCFRRGAHKSSLRRGRPNTIKTGLPSELCPKYSLESVVALKCDQSSVDMNLGVEDHTVNCTVTENIRDGEDTIMEDSVFEEPMKQINVSLTMKHDRGTDSTCTVSIGQLQDGHQPSVVLSCSFINDDKHDNINHETTDVLNINSANITTECARMPENHSSDCQQSTDQQMEALPRRTRRRISSTNSNILTPSPVRSEHESVSCVIDDILGENINKDEECWMSKDAFLSTLTPDETPACKRESIVQIMMNNAGKVQANVQHFNFISKSPCISRNASHPLSQSRSATPNLRSYSLQHSRTPYRDGAEGKVTPSLRSDRNSHSVKVGSSQKKTDGRTNRYRSPMVPPPPKFSITDVDEVSNTGGPLKEVTNIQNVKGDQIMKVCNQSQIKCSPLKNKKLHHSASLKDNPNQQKISLKRSGNSSNKISRVRSESTPTLSSPLLRNSVSRHPSQLAKKREKLGSLPVTPKLEEVPDENKMNSPASITCMATLINNQVVEEWNCDM